MESLTDSRLREYYSRTLLTQSCLLTDRPAREGGGGGGGGVGEGVEVIPNTKVLLQDSVMISSFLFQCWKLCPHLTSFFFLEGRGGSHLLFGNPSSLKRQRSSSVKAVLLIERSFYARISFDQVAHVCFNKIVQKAKEDGFWGKQWDNTQPESSRNVNMKWKKKTVLPEAEWHSNQCNPKLGKTRGKIKAVIFDTWWLRWAILIC